jgi:hypothetical protein
MKWIGPRLLTVAAAVVSSALAVLLTSTAAHFLGVVLGPVALGAAMLSCWITIAIRGDIRERKGL